jgi:hypothetical protein
MTSPLQTTNTTPNANAGTGGSSVQENLPNQAEAQAANQAANTTAGPPLPTTNPAQSDFERMSETVEERVGRIVSDPNMSPLERPEGYSRKTGNGGPWRP